MKWNSDYLPWMGILHCLSAIVVPNSLLPRKREKHKNTLAASSGGQRTILARGKNFFFFFCHKICTLAYSFFFFFKLSNVVLVLPYIEVNPPQAYMCSPSWTLLPPHTIPLGHPSAPAPSIHYGVSNLDWGLTSYMIVYMFQCHSPKSSRPLHLPQSPKDWSIHQCLFCCLVYRVIITIFLNSIYMH